MKETRLLNLLGQVDEQYVEEACPSNHKTRQSTKVRPIRRLPAALIAAILAVFLVGAGVVLALCSETIQGWFSRYWEEITGQAMSDGQAAVIDHLSQDIALSQTVGNVTITVDSATVGYDNFFLLVRVNGLQFTSKYGYGFEEVSINVSPDPVQESNGIGGYGFQYLGIDNGGAALLLMDYSYTSGNGNTRDTRPIEVSLTLKDLLQNANTTCETLLAEGEWNYSFLLDRSKGMEVITLTDTEVMAAASNEQKRIPVTISHVEQTSTGVSFQYDYAGGTLSIDSPVRVFLNSGRSINVSGGSGTTLDDGKTLNCSYQWPVPVNLDEVAYIEIGMTQIALP